MKSLTQVELDKLLATARKSSEQDYWMLLLTWHHGLRASETLSLTPEHFSNGKLTVQRLKGSKKTTQTVLFMCPEHTRTAFWAWLNGKSGPLFPIHRQTFWRRMKQYGIVLPEEKRHPHALKHTCGRLAYEAGIGIPEIQKHLGHVNGKNTMVYMEATDEQAEAAFAAKMGSK